ncbi:hypothetical protein [Croceibacterium aestuarii]|uniref:hypothetical protein n=1 Tax=Croceibacterium aestuarii TaxID=3064139 RepID=UPI00272E90C4|nr:hypothetical protein [Croceibacterium sp. D39]
MTALRLLIALPFIALAACVPSAPAPAPAPSPVPAPPRPAPSQAPEEVITPTFDNWMDAPQTPGDWTYSAVPGGSTARFGPSPGETRFAFVCNRAAGTVSLVRSGRTSAAIPMQVHTETADRTLTASPDNDEPPTMHASLPARDSFLDAIAFSKGRFAVEVFGLNTLYLPAWPEISRVIDDCR